DAAIDRDPGDPWSYAYKGWLLTLNCQYADAMTSIEEAIRRDPHAPTFFIFLKGGAALGMGRLDEAEQLLRAVARLDPDDQWAQLLLVTTYFQLGRAREAWAAAARFNDLSVGLRDFPLSVHLVQANIRNGKLGYQIGEVLRRADVPENSTGWLSAD